AERAHLEHRGADIVPVEHAALGLADAATYGQADVRAGAAHIECDDVRITRQAAEVRRRYQSGGWSRQQQMAGEACAGGPYDEPAVRLHYIELRRADAAALQTLHEARHVILDARPDIGVDDGCRQPNVFAHHRQHYRGQRDAHIGRDLPYDL